MQTQAQNQPSRPVVVAALDLAVRTEEILHTAARLAQSGGELHVVHVMARDTVGDNPLHFVALTDQARSKLDILVGELPKTIARLVLHVRIGAPDVEIAQVASDVSADVIVIGTREHTDIERLLFGTVGGSLIRNAPCAVLVSRPKTVAAWEKIEPSCPDCLAVQKSSNRATFWCERHSERHPRAHTYATFPDNFAMGAQTFR